MVDPTVKEERTNLSSLFFQKSTFLICLILKSMLCNDYIVLLQGSCSNFKLLLFLHPCAVKMLLLLSSPPPVHLYVHHYHHDHHFNIISYKIPLTCTAGGIGGSNFLQKSLSRCSYCLHNTLSSSAVKK